jgi:PAS domain-containing protein
MAEQATPKKLKQQIPDLEKESKKYTVQNKDEKYRILFEKSKDAILIIENGKFVDCNQAEWDHTRANGEVFPVNVLLTTISNQEGNRVIHTFLRDITERKLEEKARQKEKETLSIILESTPHGITLIDRHNKYLYVNPYFTEITGYTLKDIPTREDWFKKAYPEKNYRKKVSEAWGNDSNQTDQ